MTVGCSRRLRLQYPGTYLMYCPGCCEVHELTLGTVHAFDKTLGFDGDLKNPTFTPIVRVFSPRGLCSFELRGGDLHFTTNSFHDLAGKTVELPTFPLK